MEGSFGNSARVAREIDCQFRQGPDKIVSTSVFKGVAKAIWPRDTEAHIAAIASCSVRTAARYLAGEFEPPGVVLVAILAAITRPATGPSAGR